MSPTPDSRNDAVAGGSMQKLRALIRPFIPAALLNWRQHQYSRKINSQFKGQDVGEIFTAVYEENIWGSGGEGRYFSGDGSHAPHVVAPYVASVRAFLESLPEKADVVDLGCGDFNIGKQIRPAAARYVACDIVAPLIEANRELFADLDVEFRQVNLVSDPLPQGDVACIRQVLQHLDNDGIAAVVGKLRSFRHVIVTEAVPLASAFTPNIDKATGPGTRIDFGSGVEIDKPPFLLGARDKRLLCEVRQRDCLIRTQLFTM